MSDEQGASNFNLLSGSDTSKVFDGSWQNVSFGTKKVEFGTPYALSVTYDSSADGLRFQARFNYWTTSGEIKTLSDTPQMVCAKGKHVATVTIPSFDKPDDFKRAVFMIQAGDISGKGTIEVSRPMLVEGAEPAAWAPAEGETLAGGGAQMSANLWQAESVISSETQEGGIYACSGTRGVRTNVALDKLAANQTFHCGFSVNPGKDDKLNVTLSYRDAAGSVNYAAIPDASVPAGKWTRVSGSVVVPSGMTVYQMVICNNRNASGTSGWKVTNPTLSLGSPVPLASSAHTPYATQDHVAAEYATKAALKVTSDAVTAEVTERGKLAGRVGTLESTSGTHTSRLEQLAASIKSLVKGESTYTDPDGKSATSGIYSLVTQTRDSVTALFGQYTKTADLASTQAVKDAKKAGTDAASAASAAQSTADTAKTNAATAQSTANAAKGTADSLATMIREDATGITVGKSADGKTYATGRTHMGEDSFDVLDKDGHVSSSFGATEQTIGQDSDTAKMHLIGGRATIGATRVGDVAGVKIQSDAVDMVGGSGGAGVKAEFATIGEAGVGASLTSELPTVGLWATDEAQKDEPVTNSFSLTPAGYELSDPVALSKAVDNDGWHVLLDGGAWYCKRGGLLLVYLYNITASGSRTVGTLPTGYRPLFPDGADNVFGVAVGPNGYSCNFGINAGGVVDIYQTTSGDWTGLGVFPVAW